MVSYTRTFSALGAYQAAHALSYSVSQAEGGCRLFVSQSGCGQRSESVLVRLSRQEAEQALCFLYENSVPIENWKDVLKELLPADSIVEETVE